MQLSKVSVQKYRSIDRQADFSVGDFTVLIGPNNQGKSNLLRAAVLAMEVVQAWAVLPPSLGSRRRLPLSLILRENRRQPVVLNRSHRRTVDYDWDRDFPLFARERQGAQKSTVVNLEFELDEAEQASFHAETAIRTNHRLPVRVSLNADGVTLAIPKQGKGQHGEKAPEIAKFISDRVALLHVPAVRPGAIALQIAEDILQARRRALARTTEYNRAIQKIRQLDQTAVDEVEKLLQRTMLRFLPEMADIQLAVRDLERSGRLEDILVNDGVSTSIYTKGDGVQSLAALALTLEWTQSTSKPDKRLIVAVEEPESHLHPGAIHELRDVLRGIAQNQQVIVTTHSQSLINRSQLAQNVIVSDRTAKPAPDLQTLRESLGVRLSDALTTADVVVICEGIHDSETLPLLVSELEPRIAEWITDGRLIFEAAGSGSKVHAQVLAARNALIEPIVVLDSDPAGQTDVRKLLSDNYLDQTRIVQLRRGHTKATELEDLFLLDCYIDALEETIEFSLSQKQRRVLERGHEAAWSERLEKILIESGVPDTSVLVRRAKARIQGDVHAALRAGRPVMREECSPLLERLADIIRRSLRTT